MKIYEARTADLKPYPRNTKLHSPQQVQNVAESIKRYGFVQPVVVDQDNVIIIGHCRTEAAKLLGLETVPAVKLTDLTEEEVNALRIVDNKTNESPWDEDMLKIELETIDLGGFSFDFEFEDDEPEIDVQEMPDIDVESTPPQDPGWPDMETRKA